MSSKKDKLLEEAQRFALRGQLDKAIKAYQQVVALDPSAINQRQKLADLLVKAGRVEDSRAEFEAIGKSYANNGFYLKAIAVFKKLQVMFPGDMAITLNLAGLNEKHGLVANALAEYKLVYDFYEKEGNQEEALKILEHMQNVDKQNVGIKLKLAEALFQAGKKDRSYSVFTRLASLLQGRGDNAAINKLNLRIQQLFPEKSGFLLEVLAEQVSGGNAASAVNGLQALLRNNPQDKRVWELIVEAYRRLNQTQRLKAAYQHFIKFFPDDSAALKGMAECLVADKDTKGALMHLERYQSKLLKDVPVADLVVIYNALHQLDPLNVTILAGLQRVYEASGDHANAAAIAPKIESLSSLSGAREKSQRPIPEPAQASIEEPQPITPSVQTEQAAAGEASESLAASDALPMSDMLEGSFVFDDSDDEVEIEIEIDDDEHALELVVEPSPGTELDDNWLDAAGEIFDTIASAPRSVKFGSDVDSSDAQSHYDLGVAFREMGLFDEAISEFRHAAGDPSRRIDCLVLQGACLRDKGEVAKAESALRSLLKPGLSVEETSLVKYELALTCEVSAKSDEAASLLSEIDAINPGFRDVRSRLNAAGADASLDFSDEDLQGFDLK